MILILRPVGLLKKTAKLSLRSALSAVIETTEYLNEAGKKRAYNDCHGGHRSWFL